MTCAVVEIRPERATALDRSISTLHRCPHTGTGVSEGASAGFPNKDRSFAAQEGVRMSERSFSEVIADHLKLQLRNSSLEPSMPLEPYRQRPQGVLDADPPTQPVSVHEMFDDPASWW
jgi:hypothetical protein